jgi:hypothetical protein
MSEYAIGDEDNTRLGAVILMITSFIATVLVIAGLIYWTGATPRHNAAVIAADCEPTLFYPALPCITQPMVAQQYEAVVNPAIKQLSADAAAYRAEEGHNLVLAEAALSAEVSREQALNNSLAAMMFNPQNRARALSQITTAEMTSGSNPPLTAVTFTPKMTVVAGGLVQAIQALAKLNAEQARSSSLTLMRSFNAQVAVATAKVQTEMGLVSKAIAVPVSEDP